MRRVGLLGGLGILSLPILGLLGCAGGVPIATLSEAQGELTRAEIEARFPELRAVNAEFAPDPYASVALGEVQPGATVEVYFGTWCADSRRLIPRLWRALDQLGGSPPFALRYVAVDQSLARPAALVTGIDLRYVPTIVVRRGGHEVGRIVESAPHGVESDLHALLTGVLAGVVTGRPAPGEGATLVPGDRR